MSQIEPSLISSPRAYRAACDLFARWFSEPVEDRSPLDREVAGFFRSHKELNSGERRWVSSAVYGTVRQLRRQAFLLNKLEMEDSPGSYIDIWRGEQDPGESDPRLAQAIAELPSKDVPAEYIRTTLSFPDAMAKDLEDLLGNEAIPAAEALNLQAPTTLRVNPLRARMGRVLVGLDSAVQTHYSPWGIELPHRVNIFDQPGYRDGWYEIQEEASQLATLLSNVQPGMTVVDIGAGAGGKSLGLAAMMRGNGTIVAIDSSKSRLEDLRERTKRARVRDVVVIQVDAEEDGTWATTGSSRQNLNRLYGKADCVFIDSPCTGSGALRRNPDSRWRNVDMVRLVALQLKLIQQSAELVCPGGSLVYVTCAFEQNQNEDIIDAFLASQIGSGFKVEPGEPQLRSAIDRAARECLSEARNSWKQNDPGSLFTGPYLRTWPHRHNLDAFFGARLRRLET